MVEDGKPTATALLSLTWIFAGAWVLITPPEVTNTGPGFNRGSGGGARGCVASKNGWVYMRVQGGFISYGYFVCPSVYVTKWQSRSVATS